MGFMHVMVKIYSFMMLSGGLCTTLILLKYRKSDLFVVVWVISTCAKYIPIGMGMLDIFIIYYTFIATYDSQDYYK